MEIRAMEAAVMEVPVTAAPGMEMPDMAEDKETAMEAVSVDSAALAVLGVSAALEEIIRAMKRTGILGQPEIMSETDIIKIPEQYLTVWKTGSEMVLLQCAGSCRTWKYGSGNGTCKTGIGNGTG